MRPWLNDMSKLLLLLLCIISLVSNIFMLLQDRQA